MAYIVDAKSVLGDRVAQLSLIGTFPIIDVPLEVTEVTFCHRNGLRLRLPPGYRPHHSW